MESSRTVPQSRRLIPVVADVDVVIVGGTSAAVAAAVSARACGASVYLVAPRPYLGEDLCGPLRLRRDPARTDRTALEHRLFGTASRTTPAHVKATLAQVLLESGADFMFASYVTDLLHDRYGEHAGVVMANRAGRQAVTAKVLVDATDHAWVCRLAGCESRPRSGGEVLFERTVLHPCEAGISSGSPAAAASAGAPVVFRTDTVSAALPDLSYVSLTEVEHCVRDATFSEAAVMTAEWSFCVPPRAIVCRDEADAVGECRDATLSHVRPRGRSRLYILGGCADISRDEAAAWLLPAGLIGLGGEVGRAAGREARSVPRPEGVHVAVGAQPVSAAGDIREVLCGLRPFDCALPTVPCGACAVPVLADVDVLVVGGGTSGAAAAIAAVRQGMNTLVIEFQHALGGVGTVGLIGKRYHGMSAGFSREIEFPHNLEHKMEWYRRRIRAGGGRIWFGAMQCGAYVVDGMVKGAVVCTPEGRGVIRSRVVIDATGNADVAVSAGAPYRYGTLEVGDIALQGTGLPVRPVGSHYQNTDWLLVDETDMVDVRRALITHQGRDTRAFDIGTFVQSRERRRIVGEATLTYVDQIAGRTYPDSVVFSASDYDSHGYPSSIFFALLPHDETSRRQNHPAPGGTCFTPYRCMLPKGLGGILVTGLAISMDRDASALVRMQLDMANQGYAAGLAASMAAGAGLPPARIDIRALQRDLVDSGCLPAEVLGHDDSFPLPDEVVSEAVAAYGRARNPAAAGPPLAILLTHRETARPLVRSVCEQLDGESRIRFAALLAVFGECDVRDILAAALEAVPDWDEKIFQGVMADYAHLPTPVDTLILALGHTGGDRALRAILGMVERLDADVTLSHHRSVALALERYRHPAAATALAALLNKPGMQGHARTSLPPAGEREERTASLREIVLARALYRCGDVDGTGERILRHYRDDVRGLFARHARALLGEL